MNDTAPKVANLQTRRYNQVDMSVSTLNQQITELVADNEALEGTIEVAEQTIRNARKQMARNERAAEKLRAKRGIVAKAAFDAAALDAP